MTRNVPFFIVDVFAETPLSGNPLALVPDADTLSETSMRAIAREFNQSETTFLVRPTRSGAHRRLRSFTAAGVEVFGAGHNAMGAWLWLAESGELPQGDRFFFQEIGDENLRVEVTREGGRPAVVTMDQSEPSYGAIVEDRAELAASLGIDEAELVAGEVAQVASTGAAHLLVPVRDREVVDRVVPRSDRLLELLRVHGAEGCYVYSENPTGVVGSAVAHARFFNPTVGIAEDPATGTAAGPLAARLVAAGRAPRETPFFIEQGYALGRPSRLRLTVTEQRVRLSGSGLIVADGVLRL